jgi:hypothetical protein|tara:strand:+ start:606 stop:2000 length:1395 start_codon:yes stop_codon:yes gene_type:complete
MFYNKICQLLIKFKKIKHILLISYFLSFIIIVIFLGIKLKLCFIEKDKEYYQILYTTKQIHLEVIQKELIKILNILDIVHNKPNNVDFLSKNLLLNFIRISNITEHPNKPFKIHTVPNSVEITSGFYSVQVDTQLLRQFVSKNIPQNINFEIYINNQIIADNGERGNIFVENTVASSLPSLITLVLSMQEDYLSKDKSKIIRIQILEFITIITPIIIINMVFGRVYLFSTIKRLKTIKFSYSKLLKERDLLLQHMKTKNKCNELLLTKIKQKVKNKALKGGKILDDILYFPLLVEENQYSSIDSITFFEDLTSFFQYSINKKKVNFQYSVTTNAFNVNLSKESFYQLVFSLFHNVLYLLNKKSSLVIKIEIKNNLLVKIIIQYTGFQLNKEQIKSYTEEQGKGEIFLLNMNHTIQGLEKFCVNWEVKNSYDGNILQLNFEGIASSNNISNKENNIINIRDYHNK